MMSIRTILTIASYESRVLWRNWFFRIVAIMGIGFITIFNLAVFSELDLPEWKMLSNGWMLPYVTLVMISIPQVAAVIFLATGLIKKDKKLDTNEVFFVRPISNLDYVLGKALALFKLFFLLNLVLLCIPLIVGITSPLATVNPMAFVIYPLLTSIPSIVFTTGVAFLLVTVIRNQPISIVLLIGISGLQLIYYFDQFSYILDFMAFRLSMLASEMTGFVDIAFALWQRAFYFLTGIGLLFITAFVLDRLSGNRRAHIATVVTGALLLLVSSTIMVRLWNMRHDPIALRNDMISVNGRWANHPNVDITSHAIKLEWATSEIIATSDLAVKNNTSEVLDTIFFSLNPGLVVDSFLINNQVTAVQRDLQIVSTTKPLHLAPGETMNIRLAYHGTILEAAAHLEVDQNRYENANEFLVFALWKKYAFLQDNYVLLTKDVIWYPDTEVGYNRKAARREKQSFINFQLTAKVPEGKTPVSQGEMVKTGDFYRFKPEYPLPHISLVIGDYEKKEIVVDSISYSVFHYAKNDYFLKQLNALGDTLSYLITDVANEYEDAQNLAFPFRRLQFVEVPMHFTAYNKIYESHQSFVQPETVFLPEEGGKINQFDFRRQLHYMSQQAAKANQVLTDKQKQANVFNDLIRKVFTKQTGSKWVYDGKDIDNADYSLFANYYDFNSGIVSTDFPLLNRSIANYLRKDKQIQNDYSRQINGISFTEQCNELMRTSPMEKILTDGEFGEISKSISLKSQYLFSYLGQTIGEVTFRSFLNEWVNNHQHQLSGYEDFRKAMLARFKVDIGPVIRKVYAETSQPAFEILDVKKYEVLDGDRKRYQVLIKMRNSGDSDGVIQIAFNTKKRQDDDDYYDKVNEEPVEQTPGKLALIKRGETKLLGFVLDEKPNDFTVNTIISRNIPSVLDFQIGTLTKNEGGSLFDGERTVVDSIESTHYEVIVDNEDPQFTHFSPIEPTLLKAYMDSKNAADQKYFGAWSSSYSKWQATTGSDFYGSVIRSAHFTRSGSGDKVATWTPVLKEEGFYDIYVYMQGKNQNQYVGNDGDGKQFEYHYTVRNGDGVDHLKFNISNAEPGWNYLGSYYFKKSGGSVSLTDACDLRTVFADAVKWVKQ